MPRWTNELSLPYAVQAAVESDPYHNGGADFSCTELIGPARLHALRRKYDEELVIDVSDNLASLYGRSVHAVLERADVLRVPGRFTIKRSVFGREYAISGQGDSLVIEDELLDDYKNMIVHSWNRAHPEHAAQLNIYRLQLHENGIGPINRLRIVGLLAGWSKGMARRSEKYPQRGAAVKEVEVWSLEQTNDYLMSRLEAHVKADAALAAGEEPEECTSEEQWRKPTIYKVKKAGRKSALPGLSKLTSLAEAEYAASQLVDKKGQPDTTGFVETHPGGPERCINWCVAGMNGKCSQWNAEKEAAAAKGIDLEAITVDDEGSTNDESSVDYAALG